jgi:hypothetical protein
MGKGFGVQQRKSCQMKSQDMTQDTKRKLLQLERDHIVEKSNRAGIITKKIAAWAADECGFGTLAQNTISGELNASKTQVPIGKLTIAQRNLILEHYKHSPKMTQDQLRVSAQKEFNLENPPSRSAISSILNKKLKWQRCDSVRFTNYTMPRA